MNAYFLIHQVWAGWVHALFIFISCLTPSLLMNITLLDSCMTCSRPEFITSLINLLAKQHKMETRIKTHTFQSG